MIPTRLVPLGEFLDFRLEEDGRIRRIGLKGRAWLCSDLGKRRLFVVPVRTRRARRAPSKRGGQVFELWNDRPANEDFTVSVRVGPPVVRGRCLAIGYRSNKWGRKPTDYEHQFTRPPRVTQLGAVYRISGGALRVTARGITG